MLVKEKSIINSASTVSFKDGVWQFLKEQWRMGTSCDVEIKGQSKTLHAHSFILATASPYFKTLLYGPMKQSKANSTVSADLSAFSDNSLELLLKLVYEDEACSNNDIDITDFLLLLDYLQIDSYFNVIVKAIRNCISLENCLQLFELSSRCNIKCICDYLAIYIGSNLSNLIETESYREISNDTFPSLIKYGNGVLRELPFTLFLKVVEKFQTVTPFVDVSVLTAIPLNKYPEENRSMMVALRKSFEEVKEVDKHSICISYDYVTTESNTCMVFFNLEPHRNLSLALKKMIKDGGNFDYTRFFHFGGQLFTWQSTHKRQSQHSLISLGKYNMCKNSFEPVGTFQSRKCYPYGLFLPDFFEKDVFVVVIYSKEINGRIESPYYGILKIDMESYVLEDEFEIFPCRGRRNDMICYDQQQNLVYILNKHTFMTYSLNDGTLLYKTVRLTNLRRTDESRRKAAVNKDGDAIYIFSEKDHNSTFLSVKKFNLIEKSLSLVSEYDLGDELERLDLISNEKNVSLYIHLGYEPSDVDSNHSDGDTGQCLALVYFSWEKESLTEVHRTGELQQYVEDIVELPSYFFLDGDYDTKEGCEEELRKLS